MKEGKYQTVSLLKTNTFVYDDLFYYICQCLVYFF